MPTNTSSTVMRLLGLLCLGAAVAGCSSQPAASPAKARPPRVEKLSSGPVDVTFTFDPPVVRLDRDTLCTVRVEAPTNVSVRLPAIESRLTGFVLAGSYDSPAESRNGRQQQERHVRLTPQVAPRYRVAPMAIVYRQGEAERWFATRPVVLESEAVSKDAAGRDIGGFRGPLWIYPGLKSFGLYTVGILALAALGYGLRLLARRVRRAVRLYRMSPRERALHELAELIARDLITRHQVKTFYFELTMIVRTYIERAHGIRAPEQTTEEFLLSASRDPRFAADVVARLQAFLQAADLVKYAAFQPERPAVDQALATARNYIETDSEPVSPRPNAPGSGS